MKPKKKFHPDCVVLAPPAGSEKHIDPLYVLPIRYEYLNDNPGGNEVMVSAWEISWRDLLRLLFTRTLYLCIMGTRWPPLFIETDKAFTGIDEYDALFGSGES